MMGSDGRVLFFAAPLKLDIPVVNGKPDLDHYEARPISCTNRTIGYSG